MPTPKVALNTWVTPDFEQSVHDACKVLKISKSEFIRRSVELNLASVAIASR